ncbi:uncharacterized protein LOC123891229 [Trifolium pratense]|uniref:uncharacterized protein LOC123891229 n=1 Tax=Trifolium pratense TaxID=57577 RepID=UPI001E68FE7F|nr:uncharacterized protein LOC123891229 [Trifolium pratense]
MLAGCRFVVLDNNVYQRGLAADRVFAMCRNKDRAIHDEKFNVATPTIGRWEKPCIGVKCNVDAAFFVEVGAKKNFYHIDEVIIGDGESIQVNNYNLTYGFAEKNAVKYRKREENILPLNEYKKTEKKRTMRAIPVSTQAFPFLLQPSNTSISTTTSSSLFFSSHPFHSSITLSPKPSTPFFSRASKPNNSTTLNPDNDDDSGNLLVTEDDQVEQDSDSLVEDGVYIEVMKLEQKNSRRIESRISIDASLHSIWNILTDYERLADFIPGLALSKLIQKGPNFARLLQIGEQNLAFGLKFDARGVIDCYEKELETLPSGMKRDIDFKMVEGDFQLFEGKWSILQTFSNGSCEESPFRETNTTLSYIVEVKPKMWLPIRLIEGRLCSEIKKNLTSIRGEAQKATDRTVNANQFE